MRRRTKPNATVAWSPWRLRLLLLFSTGVAVLAVAVLVWTVIEIVLHGSSADESESEPASGDGASGREAAAELSAARPGALTTTDLERIRLPRATELGVAGVPTGFPQTPEGALAQLAAIDQAALSSASLPDAQAVAEEWIADGGPTAEEWSVVSAVQELLVASGQAGKGSALNVVVEPTMGAFRLEDSLSATHAGAGVVTPCVDFVVSVTTTATDQIAAADCQRMVWDGTRWVIAPGAEEEPPESLWPGSPESAKAGWSWLVMSE
jgi:hypothetical protein